MDDFDQDVSVQTDGKGTPIRTVHHVLKVFLIDRHAMARDFYSLTYLQPDLMLNDMRTLVMENCAP